MREDILGALKSALIRGETLKRAMMTLYSAGYKKKEIEEAAAALQQATQQQRQVMQKKQVATSPSGSQNKTQHQITQKIQEPKTTSQMNNTSAHEKPKSKTILILLILSLVILTGILIGVFLFKSELIEFFNNLFK